MPDKVLAAAASTRGMVRVADFERALSHLPQEYKSILLVPQHLGERDVSTAAGISICALFYKLLGPPILPRTLDRL
jgi:hypothetical protein